VTYSDLREFHGDARLDWIPAETNHP